jgi:hypothetical protein
MQNSENSQSSAPFLASTEEQSGVSLHAVVQQNVANIAALHQTMGNLQMELNAVKGDMGILKALCESVLETASDASMGTSRATSWKSIKLPALPLYDGQKDPAPWLTHIEQHLQAQTTDQAEWATALPKLVLFFSGYAKTWWDTNHHGKLGAITWAAFSQLVKDKFEDPAKVEKARARLRRLVQSEGSSLLNYTSTFQKIAVQIPDLDPTEALSAYRGGLLPDLKQGIFQAEALTDTSLTLQQVQKLAHRLEGIQRPVASSFSNVTVGTSSNGNKALSDIVCHKCGQKGQKKADCPKK